jgi:hypothetical protein
MPARALTRYEITQLGRDCDKPVMSFSSWKGRRVTAPRSLRELFDQLGLTEVPSTEGTVVMEMPVDERTVNFAAVD